MLHACVQRFDVMDKTLLGVKFTCMFFWTGARVFRAIPVPPTRSAHAYDPVSTVFFFPNVGACCLPQLQRPRPCSSSFSLTPARLEEKDNLWVLVVAVSSLAPYPKVMMVDGRVEGARGGGLIEGDLARWLATGGV